MTPGQQGNWQGALPLKALAALAAVSARASSDSIPSPTLKPSSAQSTNPPSDTSLNPSLSHGSASNASSLRGQILSSLQQLLPTMLASSVSNTHTQQMLVGVLQAFKELLGECQPGGEAVATPVATDLLTGMEQLTKVCIFACSLQAPFLWLVWMLCMVFCLCL